MTRIKKDVVMTYACVLTITTLQQFLSGGDDNGKLHS
jgi:hypothetical protein